MYVRDKYCITLVKSLHHIDWLTFLVLSAYDPGRMITQLMNAEKSGSTVSITGIYSPALHATAELCHRAVAFKTRTSVVGLSCASV